MITRRIHTGHFYALLAALASAAVIANGGRL